MSSIEDRLVEEYEDSLLMGTSIGLSTIVKTNSTQKYNIIRSSFTSFFTHYINLRVDSIVVDMLIRDKTIACAPHVNNEFRELNYRVNSKIWDYNKKWSLSQKLYANLSETIVYVCERCFTDKYQYAVIPLDVSSVQNGDIDHKNMLVLHYKKGQNGHTVEVLLFEPNGENYGKERTKYIEFLRQVVEYSKEILLGLKVAYSIEEPVLVGGKGIQNFLGLREDTERGTRFIGLPICSLVTYWTITKWLSSASTSFQDFIEHLVDDIRSDRKAKQKEVYEFIVRFNTDIYSVFEKELETYIKKDEPLLIQMYREHISNSEVTFDVSVSVNSNKYSYNVDVEFKF